MANVFISHANEDSQIVFELAHALERRGYSTWYFERDMLPGHNYLVESAEAIKDADTFLLLISSHSLRSHEVATELRNAHQREHRIVPVLANLSHTEFARRKPEWKVIVGAAASIELRDGGTNSVVDRLVLSFGRWKVAPSEVREIQPLVEPKPLMETVWASDANQINIADLNKVVFRNDAVDDFLKNRGKYFLSANKGLGKTLLLTFKRYLLSQTYQQGNNQAATVYFVPVGKPYVDFMGDLPSVSSNHEHFLADLKNAKRLWGLALRVSALSHHSSLFSPDDAKQVERLAKTLLPWVQGSRVEPSVVFKEVLNLRVTEINKLLDKSQNFFELKFRQIRTGTFCFLDKVDQAIRHLSRRAWVHVQAGLIEAAWDAMNANNHVRFFATIRQEAFCTYESDIKVNLFGATTIIRYSDVELRQLLDQLTQCYEGGKTFKQLINLNVVRDPIRGVIEDSFDFMRRHSLGRPRDLVIMASEIAKNRSSLAEPDYRRLVADISAMILVKGVFSEMRVFLERLNEPEERIRFFKLLPWNILTRDDVRDIRCRFNYLDSPDSSAAAPDPQSMYDPFAELYSAGFLGMVMREPGNPTAVQRFKRPHDMVNDSDSALPDADIYLLHPALDGFIRAQCGAQGHKVFQHIVVGHNYKWDDYCNDLYAAERALLEFNSEEFLADAHFVLKEIAALFEAGRKENASKVLEECEAWNRLKERVPQERQPNLLGRLEALIA